jgi:hypothetical protein
MDVSGKLDRKFGSFIKSKGPNIGLSVYYIEMIIEGHQEGVRSCTEAMENEKRR